MPAIIHNGRYYHFFDPSEKGVKRYEVRKVQTKRGLLMLTSLQNFTLLDKSELEEHMTMQNRMSPGMSPNSFSGPGFFLFDSIKGNIEIHSSFREVIKIPYTALKDLGSLTLFEDPCLRAFQDICFAEPELGIEAIYRYEVATGAHGSFVSNFLKNAEGILLEDLINHPYAQREEPRQQDRSPPNHTYHANTGLYTERLDRQRPQSFPGSRPWPTMPEQRFRNRGA